VSDTSTPMELAFPMAEGPGAGADMARWRLMACVWSDDGVVRGVGDQFHFHGWQEPGVVALGPGAVWVNGFYARNEAAKLLLVPGDDGSILATIDTNLQRCTLDWADGLHGWGGGGSQVTPWWQIPIWELHGHGQPVTDRRNLIPPVPPPPPITEIPAWVPRGYFGTVFGPTTTVQLPVGATDLVTWDPAADGRWVVGRVHRYTAHVPWIRGPGTGQVRFFLTAAGYSERVSWGEVFVDPGGFDCWAGTASFIVRAEAGMQVRVWAQVNFGTLTVPASIIRLDIEDAGI
jgi:hypothetical protein